MKRIVTSHGNRIRGSIKPFLCEDIRKVFNEAIVKNATADILQSFRLLFKEAIYLRYIVALRDCRIIFNMTELTENIIYDYLTKRDDHSKTPSFVRCVNAYFTGDESANEIELNDIKCHSKVVYKSLKHAEQDCVRAVSFFIKPIYKNIKDNLEQYNNELFERYRDINDSVDFINYYFMMLFTEEMPESLDPLIFFEACKYDMNVAEHYVFDNANQKYNIIPDRNNYFSTINQESATFIICNCWG